MAKQVEQSYRNALAAHTLLKEYRIERVLGAGGFGITYLARDTNLDKEVALKEYLPGELALRAPDGKVVAQGPDREAGYRWGLERFLQEARTLAKFSHPHIVRVLRYFEANATAYMVMEYEQGDSLKVVLARAPQPPEETLKALAAPLLGGLAAVHAAGFLHRDIKPDNIFLRAEGSPVLIDFGAARQALGGETRSLTAILTPGYAPLEQYAGEGKQGPWTDLYAMGAVLFRAVTGKNPPDAVTRIKGDMLGDRLNEVRGRYSESFLQAIEWALALDEKSRPQSVDEWKRSLLAVPAAETVLARSEPTVETKVGPRWPGKGRWYAIGAVLVAALIAAGAWKRHNAVRQMQGASLLQREQTVSAPGDEKAQFLRRKLEMEFRSIDADADGFISPDELRTRFPVAGREWRRADADGFRRGSTSTRAVPCSGGAWGNKATSTTTH